MAPTFLQVNDAKAPTCEEEAELFTSTAPLPVRLPCSTPPFNITYAATRVKQAVSISSARDFSEDEACVGTEELFTDIPRVCMLPSASATPSKGKKPDFLTQDHHTEEIALFTDDVTINVRLPQTEVDFNLIKTASDGRQAISTTQDRLPPVVGRALDDDLVKEEEKVIRVKLSSYESVNSTVSETVDGVNPSIHNFKLQTSKWKPSPLAIEFILNSQPVLKEPPHGLSFNYNAPFRVPQQPAAPSAWSEDAYEFVPRVQDLNSFCSAAASTPALSPPFIDAGASDLDFDGRMGYMQDPQPFSTMSLQSSGQTITGQEYGVWQGPDGTIFAQINATSEPFGGINYQTVPQSFNSMNLEVAGRTITRQEYSVWQAPDGTTYAQVNPASAPLGESDDKPVTDSFSTISPEVVGKAITGQEYSVWQGPNGTSFAQIDPACEPIDPVKQAQFEESQEILATKAHRGTTPAQFVSPEVTEFRRQQAYYEYQPEGREEAHHFSFLGMPLYDKTATPPATSLALITGTPKLKLKADAKSSCLRREAVLHNATPLVDPVVYHGDLQLLKELKGSELENAVIGNVHKAYGYGLWQEDSHGWDEDVPERDPLDKDQYDSNDQYFNATMRLKYITQPRALEMAESINVEVDRKKQRRKAFTRVKSALSEVESHSSDEESVVDNKASATPESQNEEGFEGSNSKEVFQEPASQEVVVTPFLNEDAIVASDEVVQFTGFSAVEDDKAADTQAFQSSEIEPALAISTHEPSREPDEQESESEIESIHPELVISPLKVNKLFVKLKDAIDPALEISPLKLRKTSGESSESGDVQADSSAEHSSVSSESSYGKSEESKAVLKDVVETPEEDRSEVNAEVSKEAQSPVAVSPSTTCKPISIDLPLRPKPKSNSHAATTPLDPLKDIKWPSTSTATIVRPFGQPIDGHALVRSPECGDIRAASLRPKDVKGNDRMIYLRPRSCVRDIGEEQVNSESPDEDNHHNHIPHLPSLIQEESPNKVFFEDNSQRVDNPEDVSTELTRPEYTSKIPTSITPPRHQLKRRATVHNLSSIAEEQKESPSTPTRSPFKRPSAPAPSRMLNHTVIPQHESDSEAENDADAGPGQCQVVSPPSHFVVFGVESPVRSPKGKERDFVPRSPLAEHLLQVVSNEEDELEAPASPSPISKATKKYDERFPSGQWFSQTWTGSIEDPVATDDEDGHDSTLQPISPPADTPNPQPVTPEAVITSKIGVTVPNLPPSGPSYSSTAVTLVNVQTTTGQTPLLGVHASSYLDNSNTSLPSPARSFIDLTLHTFSGIQGAAVEFGEYRTETPAASPARNQSQAAQSLPSGPLLTNHLTTGVVTEDLLPQNLTQSRLNVTSSPILSQATAFTHANAPRVSPREVTPPPPTFRARDFLSKSARPSLRASSWTKIESKLQKKRSLTAGQDALQDNARKETRKGRFGKWIEKVFRFGKGKDKGKLVQ